jgi:hypothetical protein
LDGEPFSPAEAKRRIVAILTTGDVAFSGHARRELAKDSLTTVDAANVLRAGSVDPAEAENGEWRYRVRTQRMAVVVAFRSETELRIVTAWRFRP